MSRTGRRLAAVAVVSVVAMVAACADGSEADRSSEPTAEEPSNDLPDVGLLRMSDFPDRLPFEGWGITSPDEVTSYDDDGDGQDDTRIDTSLMACTDPAASEPAVRKGLVDSRLSDTYGSSTDSTTTIYIEARNAVYLFGTEQAARDAFAALDTNVFESCIAEGIQPNARDSLRLRESMTSVGDESTRFSASMNDFEFFVDNDNGHDFSANVSRVGRTVVVTEFIFGGQYFDDVQDDLSDMETAVVEAVVTRITDAT